MNDQDKTKAQLIQELNDLRQRFDSVEGSGITESKQTEADLWESEERIRLITDNVPGLFAYIDRNKIYQFVNAGYERWFGLKKEEIIGKHVKDLLDERAYEISLPYITKVLAGNSSKFEGEVRTESGDFKRFLNQLVPHLNDDGTVAGYFALVSDITSIHLSEMTAEESNERYRILTDTAFDGIVLIDKGKMIDANDAFLESFGYAYDEIVGMPVGKLVAPEDQELVMNHFNSGSMEPYEHRALHKDGTVLNVEVQPSLVRYEGHEVRLTAIRDITERKQVEEALSQANTIINRSPVVAFLWRNEDGWPVEYVSKNVKKLFGYTATEFLKEKVSYSQIIHAEDLERVAAEVASSSQKEGLQIVSHTPYRIITKNGKIKWVDDTSFIRRNSQGILTHFEGIVQDITGRKEAEEALVVSEEKYRNLFMHSKDALLIIEGGKFIDCNPATVEMLGYSSKEEFLQVHPSKLSPPIQSDGRDSNAKADEMMEIALTKGSNRFEWDHQKADGTVFPVEVSLTTVARGDNENIIHTLWRDITEQKQSEQIQQVLLKISLSAAVADNLEELVKLVREHLGEIIDTTNFYIALYDQPTGGYTFPSYFDQYDDWGDTMQFLSGGVTDFVRISGKSNIWELESLDKTPLDEKITLYGTDAKCWLGAPLQTKEGVIGVLALQSYDDAKAYTQKDLKLVDSIIGTIAIAIEKKQTEEALAKSEQDLRNLYNNALEGIFRTAPDGKFLFANPAMAKMFGYESVADITKVKSNSLYVGLDQREKQMLHFEKYGYVLEPEFEMLRKDGSRIWVRVSSTIVKDDKGKTKWYEGFISDISESKKLEQELLKAQKLESVGLLAGGLAHDFNNVLATIQLQTALATLKDDVPATVLETLKAIEESVTKAMGITQQMLTFSKGGTPVRKTTDMEALIQESVQFALAGTNVSPTFEIDKDLHNSEVDHNQINQVVSNLVINARHAMPMGGDLKIVAKNISVKRGNQIGPLKRGEYICVSIEDQGHGIESANLDKIFDPYFTTKQQGSGLGLFSCYSIIDKHDGWMTAESEIGEGSVFTFYLPKSTADIPESANNSDSQDVIKGMGNVLIMDDNDSLRDSLAALLKSLGYTTSVSADGEAAIRLFSEALEAGIPFDVVILDLTVPNGLGGEETIKRLMKIDPDVKAIVSSGYSDDSVIADHKAHGFRAVLPKPYTLDMLSEVVKNTIDQA